MSQRGKRPNRSDDGAIPAKRRKVNAAYLVLILLYFAAGGVCLYRKKDSGNSVVYGICPVYIFDYKKSKVNTCGLWCAMEVGFKFEISIKIFDFVNKLVYIKVSEYALTIIQMCNTEIYLLIQYLITKQ